MLGLVEEVILSFKPSEASAFEVLFNNSKVGVFRVPEDVRGIRELRFSELDRFGEVLGSALFGQCDRLVTLLRAASRSSRLVLEFRKGSESLLGLPWEFVKHPDSGKPLSLEMPFVRRIGKGVELEPIESRPLRVLVVVCEPLALQCFDARKFHDVIVEEAKRFVDKGLLQLEFLSLPSTPDVLGRRVLKDCPDVVHFVGHGNVGVLAFEDNGGDVISVEAERFNVFFQNGALRLVILTACFSGTLGGTDLISGTATAIVQAGVPAVLAMQLPIEVESACRLVGDLYAILLKEPFDKGVKKIRASRFFSERLHTPAQWGIPVFYLQDRTESLFDGTCKGEGFLRCWTDLSPTFELPARPELFVGRKDLLPKVNWALVDNKIVVLHGLSGMGKSFLARELCNWHKSRGTFSGGIIWLDMGTELTYPMVLEKVGLALKVEGFSEESIRNRLASEKSLLVLDSFERVVANPDFARFLQSLPNISRVLLTTTEWVSMGRPIQIGEMNERDAVELFYRRAKQEGWDGTGKENVFDICKELGFVPLFIELVAPRAASVPTRNLLKEVSQELGTIAAERPDLPERQRTALAAFRFSYDPLDPQEKLLFAVTSVFLWSCFSQNYIRSCGYV